MSHSPLGASGAHRWMKCPGSVGLGYGVDDPESDHAALGTAAHHIGAECLKKGVDAWTFMDAPLDIPCDKEMADAVQVYLDTIRRWHPDRHQGNSLIERSFYCPDIHKYFYGTADFVYVGEREVHVWDYKYGAGIVVEVKENPQCMYYACGVLSDLALWDSRVDTVVLHIVQPRGFHYDGPVRDWSISVDDLHDWLWGTLVPAMDRALVSRDTVSGEHCRFCPSRLMACPQLAKDMDELEKLMKEFEGKGAADLSNDQVARYLDLFDTAKITAKAAEQVAFTRLSAGHEIPGRKLAAKRPNREWKKGAEKHIVKKFGKNAYTEPALKSPAQIDAMPEGKALTTRYAFKPDTGLTVVKGEDARQEVSPSTKSMFQKATNTRKGK